MKRKIGLLITVMFFLIIGCGDNSITSDKITGVWIFQHEPTGYIFNPDFTYQVFVAMDSRSVIENGTWKLENNKLVLTKADNTSDAMEVHLIDNYLLMGAMPTDEDLKELDYASVNDYIKEWGYLKDK